jgi:O-methyltransferase involved in polyketide biosynthesis
MPEMATYFREAMAAETPRCRLEFVAADLRDAQERHELFADAAKEGPVLVITEGLLVYLEPEDVAALARDLHDVAKARWWLSDLSSPKLVKVLERTWVPKLRDGNAPFLFGPAESTAFFGPYGWKESEYRSTWDESIRLDRSMRGIWLWRLLARLQPKAKREERRRMLGIMLLHSEH